MRDLLHDPAIHRQLTQAVRTRCPKDWKASRRHRLARLWTAGGKLDRLMNIGWFLVSGVVLAAPCLLVEEARLQSHEAAGLTGFHLLCASLIAGRLMRDPPALYLSPLMNMPVMLVQMHLHVIICHLRSVRRMAVLGLLVFATAFYTVIIGMGDMADWRVALTRIPIAALLSFGPSLGLAWFFHGISRLALRLPGIILRCFAMIPAGLFFFVIWEFAFFMSKMVPSPGSIGSFLTLLLPQAQLCQWVAGGSLPLQAALLCLAFTVLSYWRLQELLRHAEPELDENYMDRTPECTAEFLLAAVLKERQVREAWPRLSHSRHSSDEDSPWEDEDEHTESVPPPALEAAAEESGNHLFLHGSAPREHNVPATPEFRAAMAADLQRLLDAPPDTCLLRRVMDLAGPPPPSRTVTRKKALLMGAVPLLLVEMGNHIPDTWIEWLQAAPFLAAVLMIVGYVLWLTFWNLAASRLWLNPVWPRVPFDGSAWVSMYALRERQWWRWRGEFVLTALVAWALTCGAIVGLKTALGWQHGFLQITMLYKGLFSLPAFGITLIGLAWLMRGVERIGFIRKVSADIRWRGLWQLWGTLHLILQTLSISIMGFGLIWGLVIVDDGWVLNPLHQVFAVLLLIGLSLGKAGDWLAVLCLRHGQGSVK